MKELFQQNKKGISEMVSYVLLITIAIALSVLVYSYLKNIAPSQTAECPYPEDISLVLQDYVCDPVEVEGSVESTQVNLTFLNKGLRKIDAVYVKVGKQGSTVRSPIDPSFNNKPVLFRTTPGAFLLPGDMELISYNSPNRNSINLMDGVYSVEIQPAVYYKNSILAVCPSTTQDLDCSSHRV